MHAHTIIVCQRCITACTHVHTVCCSSVQFNDTTLLQLVNKVLRRSLLGLMLPANHLYKLTHKVQWCSSLGRGHIQRQLTLKGILSNILRFTCQTPPPSSVLYPLSALIEELLAFLIGTSGNNYLCSRWAWHGWVHHSLADGFSNTVTHGGW